MAFTFSKTNINELLVITPHMFLDDRGLYKKYYEKNIFKENGITCEFTESSDIVSDKGVIRGLHYQTEKSQAKLIHVIKGSIFDVAVDLRKDSSTFGQWYSKLLTAEDNLAMFIPEGFAHGFLALEDNTIFSYQCSGEYVPSACGGIKWDDSDLNIDWPINLIDKLIISDKDKELQSFEEFCSKNM